MVKSERQVVRPNHRIVRVPIQNLRIDPDLLPKRDDTFVELVVRAVRGSVPVYLASVPLELCVPFDADYRPDLHPVGAAAIKSLMENEELAAPMIAYARDGRFIIADDYVRLFAAQRCQVDYVACWILGEPHHDDIRDVQGPIVLEDVPRALGLK